MSACLFTVTVGFGNDCRSYLTNNELRSGISCGFWEHCCGTCDYRYCCSSAYNYPRLIKIFAICVYGCEDEVCYFGVAVSMAIVGVVIFVIVVFITCCCCPWCFMYKLCRRPRPVVTTQVTTVTNMQNIQQQPAVQVVQYPQYQPVPTQPGYGGQPMQMGPYQGQQYAPGPPYQGQQYAPGPPHQGQQYAPGPPPSYQEASKPVYPTSQSAYDIKSAGLEPTKVKPPNTDY